MSTNVQEFAHGSYGINGNTEEKNAAYIQDAPTVTPAIESYELVRVMGEEQRISAEKALLRKIDIRLLPMLILMYILNYLG